MPSTAKEMHPQKKHIISSVIKNAERKVRSIYKEIVDLNEDAVIIGADTLVTHGNVVIGKPQNEREAKNFLSKFSGSSLDVYTGLFIFDTVRERMAFGHDKSSLKVKKIDPKDLDKFFEKLGPYDKAGGFSIEGVGSMIFDDISGSYFNILGLPMGKLADLFKEIGLSLIDFVN